MLRPWVRLFMLAAGLAGLTCQGACSTCPSAAQIHQTHRDAPINAPADTPSPSEAAIGHITPEQAIETFDAAWTIIEQTHFDPAYNGVDWEGVRDELRPEAAASTTPEQLRKVLQSMLDRLGQSHFAVIPGEVASLMEASSGRSSGSARGASSPEGWPRIELRLVDGRVVVFRVEAGSRAQEEGVHPGMIVLSVGDHRVDELIDRLGASLDERELALRVPGTVHAWMSGPLDERARVEFLDAHDEPIVVELSRQEPRGKPFKIGYLPALPTYFQSRLLDESQTGSARIGLIRFNFWTIPINAPFGRAVDEMRDADGIIIDLRGNPGGIGGLAPGLAGHFLSEPLSLGTMRTRDNRAEFRANPRRVTADGRLVEPYAGPLAILVDATTGSTSELFAAGMQGLGRARVFGQRSAGAALPSLVDRLPNGDSLLHATADFTGPDGTPIEGRGVIPDEPTPLRRQDLLAGVDAALDAGVAWIISQGEASSAQQR